MKNKENLKIITIRFKNHMENKYDNALVFVVSFIVRILFTSITVDSHADAYFRIYMAIALVNNNWNIHNSSFGVWLPFSFYVQGFLYRFSPFPIYQSSRYLSSLISSIICLYIYKFISLIFNNQTIKKKVNITSMILLNITPSFLYWSTSALINETFITFILVGFVYYSICFYNKKDKESLFKMSLLLVPAGIIDYRGFVLIFSGICVIFYLTFVETKNSVNKYLLIPICLILLAPAISWQILGKSGGPLAYKYWWDNRTILFSFVYFMEFYLLSPTKSIFASSFGFILSQIGIFLFLKRENFKKTILIFFPIIGMITFVLIASLLGQPFQPRYLINIVPIMIIFISYAFIRIWDYVVNNLYDLLLNYFKFGKSKKVHLNIIKSVIYVLLFSQIFILPYLRFCFLFPSSKGYWDYMQAKLRKDAVSFLKDNLSENFSFYCQDPSIYILGNFKREDWIGPYFPDLNLYNYEQIKESNYSLIDLIRIYNVKYIVNASFIYTNDESMLMLLNEMINNISVYTNNPIYLEKYLILEYIQMYLEIWEVPDEILISS